MKKFTINSFRAFSVCLVFLIIGSAGNVHSQGRRVELTPFGGYLLGGSIKFYEGKIKIEDNASYGGMLAVEVSKGQFVELSYTRMDSKADWHPYSTYNIQYPEKTVDIGMNYLQIGSLNEFHLSNEAIRPYGTATIGTSWVHPKSENTSDQWLFTVTLGAGLKYFFSERIGIRLQASMLLPLVYNGTYFYFGMGGSGVGVSATAPIVQGNFTGGLIFVLGK